MAHNCNIDFFSLKKNTLTQKELLSREYKKWVEIHKYISRTTPSTQIIRPIIIPDGTRTIVKLPDEVDPLLQAYSGTTLILVTEAPTSNIYQWASRIYEYDGIVEKMTSHGYHDGSIWIGVLFQIVSALYVMQLHGIYIRDMTMQDNVYIKDLQMHAGKAMGYWKYVINGISYYIPNYGYLVLIDSNFKDITGQKNITNDCCKREYKIYTSNIVGEKYPLPEIQKLVYQNYKNIVSTNSFTKEHTQNNVFRPPEAIMKLLETMMMDPETDLSKVISKYFRMLMNNRIGTYLRKDTELPNIREIVGQFRVGEMAIEVIEQDVYKWCLVIGIKKEGIVEIVTREDPTSSDFIAKEVRVETLKQYATTEKIEQNISPDVNLSEEELLETYTMSL